MLLTAAFLSACATRPPAPIELNLVALNDFHGNLEASKFVYTGAASGKETTIQAGGIDAIAAALQAFRREDKDLLFVGAGDLVGASPAVSSLWADEPSITALGMLGMRFSSVGNHEFDLGRAELLRKQAGGCDSPVPSKACKFDPQFRGASFRYLAANVIDSASGKPLLPAFAIEETKGVKVAYIGAVLKDADKLVLAAGIAGLAFTDEADAINKAVGEARAQGASVFVVLIHEGGRTEEAFDQPGCSKLQGPIVDIVRRLDPAVRLIVSGHSHTGFQCKVDQRDVTQAQMGGHVLTRIKLLIDPASRAVQSVAVRNVPVRQDEYPADPKAASYLAEVKRRSEAALARPIARVAVRHMGRKMNDSGESPLGSMAADAVLAATAAQGAQIGFMNPAGLRKDLDVGDDLVARFNQVQATLPFGNTLVVMDLSGAELKQLLEQQWQRPNFDPDRNMLQVSHGLRYRWDPALPPGRRVVEGSLTLNGAPVDAGKTYRVTANNFLAEGGDGFAQFAAARNKTDTRIVDIDAFIAWLVKHDQGAAPAGMAEPEGRFQRLGAAPAASAGPH